MDVKGLTHNPEAFVCINGMGNQIKGDLNSDRLFCYSCPFTNS